MREKMEAMQKQIESFVETLNRELSQRRGASACEQQQLVDAGDSDWSAGDASGNETAGAEETGAVAATGSLQGFKPLSAGWHFDRLPIADKGISRCYGVYPS